MKIKKILFAIPIILVVLLAVYLSLPWTLLTGHAILDAFHFDASKLPKPGTVYGEFPVKLVYEINDETVTVSDIYVCEYIGYDEALHLRKWGGHMKSTKDLGFTIYEGKNEKILCRIGTADYYMGEGGDVQVTFIREYTDWYKLFHMPLDGGVIDETEVYDNYKIKLISWEVAVPIENNFDAFTSPSES